MDRHDRQLARIIKRKECLLSPFSIDYLPKITLLIKQSYSNHRHT